MSPAADGLSRRCIISVLTYRIGAQIGRSRDTEKYIYVNTVLIKHSHCPIHLSPIKKS